MRTLLISLSVAVVSSWAFAQQSPHGAIKTACNTCHTTDSWKMRMDATFDHTSTGFSLEGQHKAVPCASCHQGLKFTAVDSKCSTCHTDAHVGELGTDCAQCHTPNAWSVPDMRQKHDQTRFPLLGAHLTAECSDCHTGKAGRRYRGLPITCISCHQSDYKETKSPNHLAAGFSTDCTQCHMLTAASWGTGFDHSRTQFPLTGAHLQQQCKSCHVNNTFASLSTACVTCHQTNYNSAANPNHVTSGFPTFCQQCHTTTAWKPSTFDHATTQFPLTGAHLSVVCTDCHTNNQYANLSTSCSSCHLPDFNKTTNPNHVTGGFPQDCAQCHSTTAWQPSTFSHAQTNFPLTGAHLAVACTDCHKNNQYAGLSTSCYSCHSGDFTQTTNPNHVNAQFPQDCAQCHTTTAWQPASFDHATTKFPLTGAHLSTACLSCHVNGNYQLAYTDCYQCHATDFTKSTTFNHVTGNLSHNCETCHTTTAWLPSTFDHDAQFFRIYSGKHRQAWSQCSQCHATASYADFTCLTCHEHAQSSMDNAHSDVRNYFYESPSCYSCHRNV